MCRELHTGSPSLRRLSTAVSLPRTPAAWRALCLILLCGALSVWLVRASQATGVHNSSRELACRHATAGPPPTRRQGHCWRRPKPDSCIANIRSHYHSRTSALSLDTGAASHKSQDSRRRPTRYLGDRNGPARLCNGPGERNVSPDLSQTSMIRCDGNSRYQYPRDDNSQSQGKPGTRSRVCSTPSLYLVR
jgi:hypothetical protein